MREKREGEMIIGMLFGSIGERNEMFLLKSLERSGEKDVFFFLQK